ncbi:MAG TPA: hemolysin family protein [Anaerolineae bacterium]
MTKLLLLGLSLPGLGLLIAAATTTDELPGLSSLILPGLIILVLIGLNGLFVLAEFAIIGVRDTQIEEKANEGSRVGRNVLSILRSPNKQNRYIATAQLGITIASLGLGMVGEPQIGHFIEPYLAWLMGHRLSETVILSLGSLIAVSLLTYLHIVLGEMVPKSVALSTPVKAVFAISRPMGVAQTIFTIPVLILNGIGDGLLRLFRIHPDAGSGRLHSPEELELIVAESAEEGILKKSEEEMIRKIFDFTERQVNQIMTPRPKVEAIVQDMPLPELLKRVTESNHSRFPVYDEDLDHIIGVLHIKDLVRQQTRLKGNFDIRLLLRPAPVVPEHYPVKKLLAALKRQRTHMAIVLDEFGGTAGIVTLEDLVEEVVGEVRDEFDLEYEPFVQVAPGVIEVAGNYLIDDLIEDIQLHETESLPDVETVGGLIMTKLGRLPQVGDKITINDRVQFTVLAVEGLAVARAQVEFPIPRGIDQSEDIS